MKTTYINNQGIKCGFIISKCGRWVDCFKGSESNIIDSFFTFGRHTTNTSKPNLTVLFSKTEIALQQRFGVLMRGQTLVASKCDKVTISKRELEHFKKHKVGSNIYIPNFLDFLNTQSRLNNREKTAKICEKLLN